ncbi:MAG TPA: flagellar hook capping FlgD N-terminal domain-containing protein [Actinomycetota bacterium]
MADGTSSVPGLGALGALGAIGGSAVRQSSTAGLGSLSGDAFMKLMIAQMKYQNPFEPMDTSAMLQQTASLTTVETLQQVSSSERLLLGLQQSGMAASFVGRSVVALDASGQELAGVVRSIRFTADGPLLQVGTASGDGPSRDVPIASVTSVASTS